MDYWQWLDLPQHDEFFPVLSNLYEVISERGIKYGSAFAQRLRPVALFLVSPFGNQSHVIKRLSDKFGQAKKDVSS
jgi:hypothetical protein